MHLKFISAQPATQYYAWQVEVYIENFKQNGYDLKDIQVVATSDGPEIPNSWIQLMNKYTEVEFFIYKDNTGGLEYQPAIQSYMLAEHWRQHPELSECAVFFHDADFIFTRHLDFTPFLQDDIWYLSDTISYIGSDYIKSKSEDVLNYMCYIAEIDRSLVEMNQNNSGGAQKLMKNVTHKYWDNVYKLSTNLYTNLKKVAHIKQNGDPHGIQVWTASMWAELWTAWKMGHKTLVPKEFDFCWATCMIDRWDQTYFFHNAGVANSKSGMFFKGDYITDLPYGKELEISKDRCSSKYYELVQSIDSCLI